MPKFELCSKYLNLQKIDFFLLPGLEKKFQQETLDCLNIPKNKRISSKEYRHIKGKKIICLFTLAPAERPCSTETTFKPVLFL